MLASLGQSGACRASVAKAYMPMCDGSNHLLVVCNLMFVLLHILIFIQYSKLVVSAWGQNVVPENNRKLTLGCFSADYI